MTEFKPKVIETLGMVLSILSGGFGLVAIFLPQTGDSLKAHATLGWGLLFGFVLAAPVVGRMYSAHVVRAAIDDAASAATQKATGENSQVLAQERLSARKEAAEAVAAQYSNRDKDVALIRERLGDWTIDSAFFEYCIEYAHHSHFPSDVADDIVKHVTSWARDDRRISDPVLQRAWDQVYGATVAYSESMFTHMWAEDGQTGLPKGGYLSVPSEWKSQANGRYQDAHAELNRLRLTLISTLRTLFADLHEAQKTISG